ncbi:MAG: hypothetical protein R3C14_07340 [Caldilineaceae bacterium]
MNIHSAKRGPDRRRRAISALILTLFLLVSLLPVKAAFAQDVTNTGTVHVNATTIVHFGGNFTNNSSATVTNDGNIEVAGAFTFQNGAIDEPNNGIVIFLDNATATNAADASHIDGTVRKIGNDGFTFPTGDGGRYGPLDISAPANATDQIDARYWLSNPQTDAGTAFGAGITEVSAVEYWNVSGAAAINLTLHWDSNSGIATLSNGNLANLRVVGWNGAQWVDLGNAAVTGTATAGAITANGITPNSYQAYTLGTAYVPQAGIEYKVVYNAALNRYEIWMRSTVTPGAPGTTGTSQVTIKAPHLMGSGAFTATNITAQVANTAWVVTSRTDAPTEDTRADYLSFELDFPTNNNAAINWQGGQEILMFTFTNGGICAGPVSLMENNDPFNVAPNNPGQQIDVVALGSDPGNDFLGNYNLGAVLSAPGNTEHNRNYIVVGYSAGDVNLDGRVIAAGPGNDINPIYNGVFLHPTNSTIAANYIIQERLP